MNKSPEEIGKLWHMKISPEELPLESEVCWVHRFRLFRKAILECHPNSWDRNLAEG